MKDRMKLPLQMGTALLCAATALMVLPAEAAVPHGAMVTQATPPPAPAPAPDPSPSPTPAPTPSPTPPSH